ncbi:hypothetical protein Tco_0872955 [Tanacetum coccineum]
MTSALIWQVSSGSSESGNATTLPALESSSSNESLATFRAEIAVERTKLRFMLAYEVFRAVITTTFLPRIILKSMRGLFAITWIKLLMFPHYRNILDMEYFEPTVLERKGLLQDRLFNLMLGEQNLSRIMELSPYKNIRREAYDFLEGKVEPVGSLQHSFQRDIMDGSLNFFIQDIKQSGRNSQIYHEFYSHFTDEGFRLKFGLPLP